MRVRVVCEASSMRRGALPDGPAARASIGPGPSWRRVMSTVLAVDGRPESRSTVIRTARGRSPRSGGRVGCSKRSPVGPASTMWPGHAPRRRPGTARSCRETRWACCMLWVTITMVTSSQSSRIVSSMTPVEMGSSAEHGSSMSRTLGWTARARAMHSRCCWPPESAAPASFKRLRVSFHRPAR